MVRLPPGLPAFEFVVLASLRAVQLSRGCTPRVEGVHKRIVIAQLEVASGVVARALTSDDPAREPI
jgi:DNA-directed RNA polymerase subunit K/omega